MKGTNLKGRASGRRRTADEIRSILEWQRQSGLSLLAFARKQGLCYATLCCWRATHDGDGMRSEPTSGTRNQAGHAEGRAEFVAVELEPGARPGDFILDWSAGRSLRIPAGFDADQLRRLLDVLGMRP